MNLVRSSLDYPSVSPICVGLGRGLDIEVGWYKKYIHGHNTLYHKCTISNKDIVQTSVPGTCMSVSIDYINGVSCIGFMYHVQLGVYSFFVHVTSTV